ncbi:cysteine-rich repeat secretory protein 55-like [Phalaenopsis equestris]|uniref:cysteine-rich repeat secretory protein 55-like n=1 Tax=Phalaenopsis equestris TaxID=78828 RepID=UPI0009E53DEE|nr:cysteine-rich repeat secretory protein 55-like [Phalaenopsis equestris]
MELSCKPFILVLLIIAGCGADSIFQECGKNFSISSNSLLQDNINNAIFGLLTKTALYGAATASYGVGTDTIYGLTRCRGDISREICSACILDATYKIRTICHFSAEARIWYEYCFLRYDSNNFLGFLDTRNTNVWYTSHIAADPVNFDQAVGRLLETVKVAAAAGDKKFGRGENFVYKSNITIYGMAQCTPDLQESTCNQCLDALLEVMTRNCKYHLGCYVISTSCVLRYEINDFLFRDIAPSPKA